MTTRNTIRRIVAETDRQLEIFGKRLLVGSIVLLVFALSPILVPVTYLWRWYNA